MTAPPAGELSPRATASGSQALLATIRGRKWCNGSFSSGEGKGRRVNLRGLPGPAGHHWEWQLRAACHGRSQLFFDSGSDRGPDDKARAAAAKTICAGCPVRDECLTHALSAGEEYGIWGGLTRRERAALQERNPRPDGPHRPGHQVA